MTLSELADRIEVSPRPSDGEVGDLTLLAIQLRRAGVQPTLESCADRASLAAWVASAPYADAPPVDLTDGGAVLAEIARQLVEACE